MCWSRTFAPPHPPCRVHPLLRSLKSQHKLPQSIFIMVIVSPMFVEQGDLASRIWVLESQGKRSGDQEVRVAVIVSVVSYHWDDDWIWKNKIISTNEGCVTIFSSTGDNRCEISISNEDLVEQDARRYPQPLDELLCTATAYTITSGFEQRKKKVMKKKHI